MMLRRQFPIVPAFAMTINKSQGQTIERAGIYLSSAVFAHGQLHVALSRYRNRDNIKIYVKPMKEQQGELPYDGRIFTPNVVYREVFRHGELESNKMPDFEAEFSQETVSAINKLIDEEIGVQKRDPNDLVSSHRLHIKRSMKKCH